MIGQNITLTRVSSAHELHAETKAALGRIADQSSALVLVVDAPEPVIASALQNNAATKIDISELLCERLLPLSSRDRARKAADIIAQMLNGAVSDVVWLDRVQALFEPSLELDPLRQLQELARLKPIIAIWPGQVEQCLTFSVPGRDDFQSYSANDLANVPIIHFTEQRDKNEKVRRAHSVRARHNHHQTQRVRRAA
jgi:hypothetical protein